VKFQLTSLLIFLSISLKAQTTFRLGVDRLQVGIDFTQTFDHGYLLSGNVLSDTNGGSLSDIFALVKLDSLGNMQWFKFYSDMGHDSYVTSVFQDNDGNYVFAGYPDGMITHDCVMAKVNSTGNLIWSRKFTLPGFIFQMPYPHCIETIDHNYALSYSQFDGSVNFLSLVKIDKNGNTIWERNFNDTIGCTGLAATSDNGLILTGAKESQGVWGYYLLRVNSAGSMLWYKTFNDTMFSSPEVNVIQSLDNGFLATASLSTSIIAIRTDSIGDTLWIKNLTSTELQSINSIVQTSDSNFILGGYIGNPNTSNQKVLLVKMSGSGDTLWTRTYTDWTGRFSCNDIEEVIDGGLVSFCAVDYLTCLLKTDSNGNMTCDQISSSISFNQNTLQIYNSSLSMDSSQGSAPAGLLNGTFWSNTSYYCLSLGEIETTNEENNFQLFPNPSTTEITISSSSLVGRIKIYDAFGVLVKESLFSNHLNVSNLTPGIYFIHLQSSSQILTKKFIKQ
jgi:hypothetical protein